MKVLVDSNMAIHGVFEPPFEVELTESNNTLRALLEELSDLCQTVEFINGDEIGSDIETVLVNGKEHYYVNINLKEGDKVKIMVQMVPLGGG